MAVALHYGVVPMHPKDLLPTYVRTSVAHNRTGLSQLVEGCDRLGLSRIPSVGNFLTIDLSRSAAPVDHQVRLGVLRMEVSRPERGVL